jgi:hypothetical protein
MINYKLKEKKTMDNIIKNRIKEIITESNSGTVNKDNKHTKGWTMLDIMNQIKKEFGSVDKDMIKDFIIKDICGLNK